MRSPQAKRMYEFGGVSASGEAWVFAYDKTLEDFDAIADEHNYSEHQRERGREILEELQEISHKKRNFSISRGKGWI